LWLTYRVLTRRAVPRRVFEMGFGGGALLRRFLDDGAEVSGADPEQLGVAIDAEVASRGRLWREPVEAVDPVGHEVDLVYGIHVIEHVADVESTLQVARRLLRPGGRLALFTPAGDSLGLRWFGSDWWLLEDPTHVRFFTAQSIRRACQQAGFGRVRVRRLWLDNLTMEGASVARRLRVGSAEPGGVLSSRWTMALALLSAPAVVMARGLVPRLRPTLYVEAEK
jgi:SAM-dependent methyltransferase